MPRNVISAPIRTLSVVTFFTTFFVCSVSVAGSDATTFIKSRQAELATALRADDLAQVDSIFSKMLDYETIARESLGSHWEKLRPEQQAEFRCVLRGLVSQAYRRDLRRTLDYSVTFGQSHKTTGGVVVETVARSRDRKREDPIEIDYLVHEAGDRLQVRDIITEGSSLVDNYQHQFARLIREHGYPELLRRMREKLGPPATACQSAA